MIKYLITIVLTIALCCSCNREDFSADPTIMPPATQTGANTFGCLIDGWVYTGQRYDSDDKASYLSCPQRRRESDSQHRCPSGQQCFHFFQHH